MQGTAKLAEQNAEFQYWAFISYSHHDRRVAKWLRNELRKSRSPKHLRAEIRNASSRMDAIFLDQSEAEPAANLGDKLRAALDVSRNLIVICSPFANASGYVNDEIEYFKSIGRADKIICIIASGVPNATDEGRPGIEAFPPALRQHPDGSYLPAGDRPLGLALGEETKAERKAVLELVRARLHEKTPDSWKKAQRARNLRQNILFVTAAGLALGAVGLWWLAYQHPTVSYAADYVRRNGIWEPVNPISPSVASNRDRSYRFVRQGWLGKPDEVSIVNQTGACESEGFASILGHAIKGRCGTAARACTARFTYASDGSIEKEVLESQFGLPLETLDYNENNIGEFISDGMLCSRSQSGINYIRFERHQEGDQAGLDHFRYFFRYDDGELDPSPNNGGEYGVELAWTAEGRVKERWALNEMGDRFDPNEYAGGELTEYAPDGSWMIVSYYDVQRPERVVPVSFAYKTTFDRVGNDIRLDGLDSRGNPKSNGSWVTKILERDDRGYEVSGRYLDAEGKPAIDRRTGASSWINEVDENGYQASRSFFGVDGQPILRRGWRIHKETSLYSSHGVALEIRYYDTDGSPIARHPSQANDGGYHRILKEIDGRGNFEKVLHFGPDNEPVFVEPSGYRTGFIQVFDDRDNAVEVIDLGEGHEPFQRRERDYNARGLMTRVQFFDMQGQPLKRAGFWSAYGQLFEYDDEGEKTKITLIDKVGAPMMGDDGFAIRRQKDPEDGGTLYTYFDTADDKILRNGTHHGLLQFEDNAGNIYRWCYFGLDLEKATNNEGVHCFRRSHDQAGRIIRIARFDPQGELTDSGGYAEVKYTYDDAGNETSREFFNADGTRAVLSWGASGWRSEYNAKGQQIRREFIGADGELTVVDEGHAGYTQTYTESGKLETERYIGIDGGPGKRNSRLVPDEGYYGMQLSYNENGNRTVWEFLDVDGQPTSFLGVAQTQYTYTDTGKRLTLRNFDSDGRPVASGDTGAFGKDYAYDAEDRRILERAVDHNGDPFNQFILGWAEKRTSYSASGNETVRCFTTAHVDVSCD